MSLITLAIEAARATLFGLTLAAEWTWDDTLEELAG